MEAPGGGADVGMDGDVRAAKPLHEGGDAGLAPDGVLEGTEDVLLSLLGARRRGGPERVPPPGCRPLGRGHVPARALLVGGLSAAQELEISRDHTSLLERAHLGVGAQLASLERALTFDVHVAEPADLGAALGDVGHHPHAAAFHRASEVSKRRGLLGQGLVEGRPDPGSREVVERLVAPLGLADLPRGGTPPTRGGALRRAGAQSMVTLDLVQDLPGPRPVAHVPAVAHLRAQADDVDVLMLGVVVSDGEPGCALVAELVHVPADDLAPLVVAELLARVKRQHGVEGELLAARHRALRPVGTFLLEPAQFLRDHCADREAHGIGALQHVLRGAAEVRVSGQDLADHGSPLPMPTRDDRSASRAPRVSRMSAISAGSGTGSLPT